MLSKLLDIFFIVILSCVIYSVFSSTNFETRSMVLGIIAIILNVGFTYRLYKNMRGEKINALAEIGRNKYYQLCVLAFYICLFYFTLSQGAFIGTWNIIIHTIFLAGGVYLAYIIMKNWKKTSSN